MFSDEPNLNDRWDRKTNQKRLRAIIVFLIGLMIAGSIFEATEGPSWARQLGMLLGAGFMIYSAILFYKSDEIDEEVP